MLADSFHDQQVPAIPARRTRMRILVTGGAGYIGSHAVRRLIALGHQVLVIDDLSHGHRAALHPKAAFAELSIHDTKAVTAALQHHGTEAVLHFAAFIEVGESVVDPGKYYHNNFAGALSLLDAMMAAKVGRIVFSSTAAVYGTPTTPLIDENHPCAPINPYGHSKRMVELALADFARAHDLAAVALRYFNVAGAAADGTLGEAHEPESHLLPRVLAVALGQAPHAAVFGADYPTPDGTCIRDFVHVEDLVEAHVLALKHLAAGKLQVMNVGSEAGFSVRDVITTCRRVTGHPIPVVEHSRRAGDPPVLVAASGRIRDQWGWKREHPDLETIVRHAWEWHRHHPHGFNVGK